MLDPVKHRGRRMLLTGAVTVITVAGAYAGATLKSDSEERATYQQLRQETRAEKLQRLQTYRERLMLQKTELELKIAELDEKRAHKPL